MLVADHRGFLRSRYEVRDTGAPGVGVLTEMRVFLLARTVEYAVDGVAHEIVLRRRFLAGHEAVLTGSDVSAEGVGTADWWVRAGDRRYRFLRRGWFSHTQQLVESGGVVGAVRPELFGSGADADLPTLPVDVALFVLGALLFVWADES